MRGWNAWLLCAWIASVAIGCDNEGKITSDAGGTGGVGGGGSGGSSGAAGDDPPPPPPPSPCTRNDECNDGLYCNGEETCVNRTCAAGTPPVCDDAIDCTIDRCVETRHECSFTARDDDGDGHPDGSCEDADGELLGDDCDDSDSTRFPGALEVCDADDHDEDCDLETFGRVDADGDTYLNGNCCNVQEDDSLLCGDDCDDSNPRSHPFNTESCDGYDNDCNGLLDHPLEDQDEDGFATSACGGTDCDDFNPDTYAGARERCDGLDNDCIQGGGVAADESDPDSDAFVTGICMRMDDTDLSPGDCDEGRPSANPTRTELCNGRDDDCDGATDEGDMDCSHAVKQVDASFDQTCATRVNGTVACWGRNENSALGTGSTETIVDYPRDVLDPAQASLRLSSVKQVAVGLQHACAVHTDGRVSCWGENSSVGTLGRGHSDEGVELPQAIFGMEGAEEACAGTWHSCVRLDDGTVHCWGWNERGALGHGDNDPHDEPVQVVDLDDVVDIECDTSFSCAVRSDGTVWCWGDNWHGQLGDITTNHSNRPVQVFGIDTAVQVATSHSHACAVLNDGTAKCWGLNQFGQIGNYMTSGDVLRPVQVLAYTGAVLDGIVELRAAGGDRYVDDEDEDAASTCARLDTGEVKCFGLNALGQLGYGAWDFGMQPPTLDAARYAVQELPDAIAITTGNTHACAISPDGALRCWGGGYFQIPNGGDNYAEATPLLIEGL